MELINILPGEIKDHIISYIPYEYLYIIRTKLSRQKYKEIEMWIYTDFNWENLETPYDKKFVEQVCVTAWVLRDSLMFYHVLKNGGIHEIDYYTDKYKLCSFSDVISAAIHHNCDETIIRHILKKYKDNQVGLSYETMEKLCKNNNVSVYKLLSHLTGNSLNTIYQYCLENESYDLIEYLENS